ncbi:MAG: hypothetical protein ACR2NL_11770, partial [Acidimicrobiia bacterium]
LVFRSERNGSDSPHERIEGSLREAVESGRITLRGSSKVKEVARTIADISLSEEVAGSHIEEALALRGSWSDG